MNNEVRTVCAHGLIITAFCVGGWLIFLQPQSAELNELESEITRAHAGKIDAAKGVDQLAVEAAQVRRQAVRIKKSNRGAHSSSVLYGKVNAIAEASEVQVEQITPAKQVQTEGKSYSATGLSIIVEGGYEKIIDFTEQLNAMPGFLRWNQLTITPLQHDEARLVTARYKCDLYTFNLPGPLVSIAEEPPQP